MVKYTIRRLIQSIPTLFGITLLSYLLMTAAPGDGPTAALTFDPRIPPAQRERLKVQFGVNDPWIVQYLRWLTGDDWMRRDTDGDGLADTCIFIACEGAIGRGGEMEPLPPGTARGILRGDFGKAISISTRPPVLSVIGERLPATLELGIASTLVGLLLGIPIGILAAVSRGKAFDNFTRVFAVIVNAVPVFWLGLVLILIFGAMLKNANGQPFLPMGGRCPTVDSNNIPIIGCVPLFQRMEYLILPTIVLASGLVAGYSRFMRASMLDVIGQDYVRTAKAKGLPERVVWFKHSARNALIPIATFLGPTITGVLGGAVITETIFSWPGLGRLGIEAINSQDYPLIMGFVVIGALATIIGYIISDLLYAVVDPRIRFN